VTFLVTFGLLFSDFQIPPTCSSCIVRGLVFVIIRLPSWSNSDTRACTNFWTEISLAFKKHHARVFKLVSNCRITSGASCLSYLHFLISHMESFHINYLKFTLFKILNYSNSEIIHSYHKISSPGKNIK
jgi:hypothetical protein